MDPVSQGILGASLAGSISESKKLKLLQYAAFSGRLTPDLDILIKSSTDPLLSLEFHRHFTHSIFFVPLGALITGMFLFLFLKKSLSFKNIYLFSGWIFNQVVYLIKCTSYGTQLLWPILDKRFEKLEYYFDYRSDIYFHTFNFYINFNIYEVVIICKIRDFFFLCLFSIRSVSTSKY